MKYDDAIVRLCGDYDTLEQAKNCAQVIAYMGQTAEVYYYITPGKITQYTVRAGPRLQAHNHPLYYIARFLADHGPDVVPQRLPESDSRSREQQEAAAVTAASPVTALEYAASMINKNDQGILAGDLLDWLIRIVSGHADATDSLKEFLGEQVGPGTHHRIPAEDRYRQAGLIGLYDDLIGEIFQSALDLQLGKLTPQGFSRWWRVQLGLQISKVTNAAAITNAI